MTPNSVKPLYVIMNNANRYTEENNGNAYLTNKFLLMKLERHC